MEPEMKTFNIAIAAIALTAGLAAPALASDVDRAQQDITTSIAQGRYQAASVVTEGRQAAGNTSVSANDQLFLQLAAQRNSSSH
jgi:hypothetical protein